MHAHIVVCVERNTAHEAGFLCDAVREGLRHSRISFIAQNEKNPADVGWWTDAPVKTQMAYALQYVLNEDRLSYAEDMVCKNMWLDESDRLEKTKKKVMEQLPRYRITLTGLSETNPTATPRISVSGKVDKDGKLSKGFKDDLIVSLSGNIFFYRKLYEKSLPNLNYNELGL